MYLSAISPIFHPSICKWVRIFWKSVWRLKRSERFLKNSPPWRSAQIINHYGQSDSDNLLKGAINIFSATFLFQTTNAFVGYAKIQKMVSWRSENCNRAYAICNSASCRQLRQLPCSFDFQPWVRCVCRLHTFGRVRLRFRSVQYNAGWHCWCCKDKNRAELSIRWVMADFRGNGL